MVCTCRNCNFVISLMLKRQQYLILLSTRFDEIIIKFTKVLYITHGSKMALEFFVTPVQTSFFFILCGSQSNLWILMRVDWDGRSLLCCSEECPTDSRGSLGAVCRKAVMEISSCVQYILWTGHDLDSGTTVKDPRGTGSEDRGRIFL